MNDNKVNKTDNMTIMKVGEWDEAGLLNGLTREGFTKRNSVFEFDANSCDAGAKNVKKIITNDKVKFIDDGRGLSRDGIKRMFNMCHENHVNEETMGVSGKGAKGAQIELTNQGMVTMFSYDGNEFNTIIVDWANIFKNKTLTGQINIVPMTNDEKNQFISDRKDMTTETGFTCIMDNNGENAETIREQYDDKIYKNLPRKQRTDVVFGKLGYIKFTLCDEVNGINYGPLKMFNPTELNDDQYYLDEKDTIEVYQHKTHKEKNIFCLNVDDVIYKIYGKKKQNNGISEKLYSDFPLSEYTKIGEFVCKTQLHRNIHLFDYNNPKDILSTDDNYRLETTKDDKELIKSIKYKNLDDIGKNISPYYEGYFNTKDNWGDHSIDMSECGLSRNGQYIGQKPIDGFNGATSRGSTETLIGTVFMQLTLEYNVLCNQTNSMDKIIGVQGVKAQLSECGFPKEFMGLLTHIKSKYKKELFIDWNNRIKKQIRDECSGGGDDDENGEPATAVLRVTGGDGQGTTAGEPDDESSDDESSGGVEETKDGDDDENGEPATAVQHTTVAPLRVSGGDVQGTTTGEPDDESSDDESSDDESSEDESSDDESSVTHNQAVNSNESDRTSILSDKTEQILSNMCNMSESTQEQYDEIEDMLDRINEIQLSVSANNN